MKVLIIGLTLGFIAAAPALAKTVDQGQLSTDPTPTTFPILPDNMLELLDKGWSITNVLDGKFLLLMGPDGRRPAICNYVIDHRNASKHLQVISRCYRQQ